MERGHWTNYHIWTREAGIPSRGAREVRATEIGPAEIPVGEQRVGEVGGPQVAPS